MGKEEFAISNVGQFEFVKAVRIWPFKRILYWRRISIKKFMKGVRPFFKNSLDADILSFMVSSRIVINTGRHIYRSRFVGEK